MKRGRDLHRIGLEEEPTLRLLGIDELQARYPREDVEVHCRSDHLSSLRSWRSRDWFYGPSGPRQTPMLGIAVAHRGHGQQPSVSEHTLARSRLSSLPSKRSSYAAVPHLRAPESG